ATLGPGAVARRLRPAPGGHDRHVRRPVVSRGARVSQAFRRARRAAASGRRRPRRTRRHLMAHDDDPLTGSVPDPDTEPAPGELAHARRFAELVDKTLAGRTPPAMSADDRALLEVATVIRATHGQIELAADRRSALVEDALRQAIGAG